MPGKPSSRRSAMTRSVIRPRSSANSGSSPSSPRAASNTERPGPRRQCPLDASRAPSGHRPVGQEAAEVIKARDVEELERAPQALHPPAIVPAPVGRPVIERIAPQLPHVAVCVGRGAGHQALHEQLGVPERGRRCSRQRRSGHLRSPHAASARVGAKRAPLPLKAHLVVDGPAPRRALPVRRSRTSCARGLPSLRAGDRCPGAPPAGCATPRRPTAPGRGRPGGRAARAGAPATMTVRLPPASPRNANAEGPRRPSGSEVTCSWTPLDLGWLRRFTPESRR